MANAISKETYKGFDVDSKLNVLFDYAIESHRCAMANEEKIEILDKKFDRRKRFDTAVSGASGFIGGAVMVFIKWVAGK